HGGRDGAGHHGVPGPRRPHRHGAGRRAPDPHAADGARRTRPDRRRPRRSRPHRRDLQGRPAPVRDRGARRDPRPLPTGGDPWAARPHGRTVGAARRRHGAGHLPRHRHHPASGRLVISFVGAGPGAPDLITLRGAARLAAADVVVWASSLVPDALLTHCRPDAVVHDSKTMTLEDVLAVYAAHPGAAVVRLHSGDPSIYGAIQEQIDWCVANARDFGVVPGVTSMSAAAAAVTRELTIPGVAQSVVLTRLAGRTAASMPLRESVAAFAFHGTTMAVFLSAARPADLETELLAPGSAYTADTPAVI